VGRWPRPDLLPPWEFVRSDGRYDLPGKNARVCYLAESAVAAYLERSDLRALRPDLELCKMLSDLRTQYGADDPDVTAEILTRAGRVEAEWFAKYGLACVRPAPAQTLLDLRQAAVIERLRGLMAPWLLEHGFDDFQFRDLLFDMSGRASGESEPRHITQHVAELAYAAGFTGIAYLSRPNMSATCVALFEEAALEPEATISPIRPSDSDLKMVFDIYGLHAAPGASAVVATRQTHVVDTGGFVRGPDSEATEPAR
jgi:hypothetical protein